MLRLFDWDETVGVEAGCQKVSCLIPCLQEMDHVADKCAQAGTPRSPENQHSRLASHQSKHVQALLTLTVRHRCVSTLDRLTLSTGRVLNISIFFLVRHGACLLEQGEQELLAPGWAKHLPPPRNTAPTLPTLPPKVRLRN